MARGFLHILSYTWQTSWGGLPLYCSVSIVLATTSVTSCTLYISVRHVDCPVFCVSMCCQYTFCNKGGPAFNTQKTPHKHTMFVCYDGLVQKSSQFFRFGFFNDMERHRFCCRFVPRFTMWWFSPERFHDLCRLGHRVKGPGKCRYTLSMSSLIRAIHDVRRWKRASSDNARSGGANDTI